MGAGQPGPRVRVYRCERCGAPLRVGPDTVLAVCPHCGYPNWVRGRPGELLLVEPREDLASWLVHRVREAAGPHVVVAGVRLVYVPLYCARIRVRCRVYASGAAAGPRGLVAGEASGEVRASYRAVVPGRRADRWAPLLAREALMRGAPFRRASPDEAAQLLRRGEALAAEKTVEEALREAGDAAMDAARSSARRLAVEKLRRSLGRAGPGRAVVDTVYASCRVEAARARGPAYTPMALLRYRAPRGGLYHAAASAWPGGRLIYAERPRGGSPAAWGLAAGVAAALPAALLALASPALGLAAAPATAWLALGLARRSLARAEPILEGEG